MAARILFFALLGVQTLWSALDRQSLEQRLFWQETYMDASHEAYRAERVFWCNQGIEVPPFLCSTLTEGEEMDTTHIYRNPGTGQFVEFDESEWEWKLSEDPRLLEKWEAQR